MEEKLIEQLGRYRQTSRAMGEAALEAISRGDIGLARTIARQSAQYARIVIQLETGEKQLGPSDDRSTNGAEAGTAGALSA